MEAKVYISSYGKKELVFMIKSEDAGFSLRIALVIFARIYSKFRTARVLTKTLQELNVLEFMIPGTVVFGVEFKNTTEFESCCKMIYEFLIF